MKYSVITRFYTGIQATIYKNSFEYVLQILLNNLIFEVCKNVYKHHKFCILSSRSIFKSAMLLCLRGKEAVLNILFVKKETMYS